MTETSAILPAAAMTAVAGPGNKLEVEREAGRKYTPIRAKITKPVTFEGQTRREKEFETIETSDAAPPSYDKVELEILKIPFSPDGLTHTDRFVPREELMEQLHHAVFDGESRGQKVIPIIGQGGFGKTQLALRFAKDNQDKFWSIFVLNGENRGILEQSLCLAMDTIWDHWPESLEKPAKKPTGKTDLIPKSVKKWFELPQNQKWLIIFDSVDLEPDEFDIRKYFPDSGNGTILLTTRSKAYSNYWKESIYVRKMNSDEGSKLFPGKPGEEGRSEVLDILDGCPLALIQAGRLITHTEMSFKTFLRLYQNSPHELIMRWNDVDDMTGEEYSKRNIRTTWFLSFDQLLRREASPPSNRFKYKNAGNLLLLLSYLNPQDISFDLLRRGLLDPDAPQWFCNTVGTEAGFWEAVEVLSTWSLIDVVDSEKGVYSMHNMIHESCQGYIKTHLPESADTYARLAVAIIGYSFPSDWHKEQAMIARKLLPHVNILMDRLRKGGSGFVSKGFNFQRLDEKDSRQIELKILTETLLSTPDLSKEDTYFRIIDPQACFADLLWWHRRYDDVEFVLNASLDYLQAHLKPEDPQRPIVFTEKLLLAVNAYREEGTQKIERAQIFAAQAYAGLSSAFSEESREALFAKRVQIALKSKEGKVAEALEEEKLVLLRYKKLFGPDSTATMDAMEDIANGYLANGDMESRKEILKEVFLKKREKLGRYHDETLAVAARVTSKSRDERYATEIEWHNRLFESYRFCLGDDHEDTLSEARRLAYSYVAEGNLDDGVKNLDYIVETRRKKAEDDPKELAIAIKELGDLYIKQENPQVAEKYLAEALQLAEKSSTKDELQMLRLRHNIGTSYLDLTNYSKAFEAYEPIIEPLRKVLKKSDKSWFKILSHHAEAANGIEAKDRVNAILEELIGLVNDSEEDIDDFEEVLQKVAPLMLQCQRYKTALYYYQQLHNLLREKNGENATGTLEVCVEIAHCLRRLDEIDEAERILERIISLSQGQPGQSQSDDALDVQCTAHWHLGELHYYDRDNSAAAEVQYEKALEGFEKLSKLGWAASAAYALGQILDAKDGKRSEELFRKVLSIHKKSPELVTPIELCLSRSYIGMECLRNKNFSEAKEHLEPAAQEARELSPLTAASRIKIQKALRCVYYMLDDFESCQRTTKAIYLDTVELEQGTNICIEALTLSVLGLANGEFEYARSIALKTTLLCVEFFGAEDVRTASCVRVLEGVLTICKDAKERGSDAQKEVVDFKGWGLAINGKLDIVFANPKGEDVLWTVLTSEESKWNDSKEIASELLPESEWKSLLSNGLWKLLLPILPDYLGTYIRYDQPPNGSKRQPTWTFAPGALQFDKDHRVRVPFTIAGASVIIPVEASYPPIPGGAPPDDPHPGIIDPTEALDEATTIKIFDEYDFALGFYLLLNGNLQILVPKDFDFSENLSQKPIYFGGLQVSYIPLNPVQSAGWKLSNKLLSTYSSSSPSNSSAQSITLALNDSIAAKSTKRRILGQDSKAGRDDRPQVSKIGLRTKCGTKEYLTISTHTLWNSVSSEYERKWFSSKRPKPSPDWINGVEVFAGGAVVGRIAKCYDENPEDFPHSYTHDISLVEAFNGQHIQDVVSPVHNLGWLSSREWGELKRGEMTTRLLGYRKETKLIKTSNTDVCMIVGEGMLKTKRMTEDGTPRTEEVAPREVRRFSDLVSRCVLYRIDELWLDYAGYSGTVLIAEKQDGSCGVAGFQSFVQYSNLSPNIHVQGNDLNRELRTGQASFCAAFEIPEELRSSHEIL